MVCPECGEMLNVIDEGHVECVCGFRGTVDDVNRAYARQFEEEDR